LDIARLRIETAADHRAAEESLPLMNENLCREEYVAFLLGIYGVVSAWERYAASFAPLWLQGIVSVRQRKQMLEDDLAWFGIAHAHQIQTMLPKISNEAGLLGSMYVMEGSTLGGQLISRHVTRVLGLHEGRGDAYFRGHGDRTGIMWKEFCEILRTRVLDADAATAIDSAKAMFQVFGSSMQQVRYSPIVQGCAT
jgi:heme oxygenase